MTIRNSTRARLLACSALSVLAMGVAAQKAEAQVVVIDAGDVTNVPADVGGDWNLVSITVGSSGTGILNISSGAVVTSNGMVQLGLHDTGQGLVTIDGFGTRWEDTGGYFAIGVMGHGELSITNGGVLTSSGQIILGDFSGASGSVLVDGAGSLLSSEGPVQVGAWEASGVLQLSNGGAVSAASIGLGLYGAAAHGSLIIGSDDTLNPLAPGADIAADIIVGEGTGEIFLNHTGSTTISGNIRGALGLTSHAGTTILTGANNNYTGAATFVHGGSLVIEGASDQGAYTYYVGYLNGDDGELIIRNGGTLSSAAPQLGVGSGSRGAMTVTGTGSAFTGVASLTLGQNGRGVLEISAGGQVSNSNAFLGRNAGGVGTATVTGADSLWINSGNFYVGESGTGTLTISDGAEIQAYSGILAYNPGGEGTATVTGADSLWNLSGGLAVGVDVTGHGRLLIEDGGQVVNTWGRAGYSDTSLGEILVTGADSLWSSSLFAEIGLSGDGILTVAEGGVVRVASGTGILTLGVDATGSGVLNFGAAEGDAAVAAGTVDAAQIVFGLGDGEIVFNHTGSLTVDADISGDGELKVLAGTTILSGNNSFTGSVVLDDATLSLASDTALGSATLRMTGSVLDYADGVTNSSSVVIDSDTSQFQVLTGSATQSGVISELNGPRPFEKIGAGELILTGANTWTGATTVSAGRLTVDGSVANSALNVLNGASLAGSGSVAGLTTVANGGTLVGAAGSTLTLDSLSLGSGSIIDVTLDAPSATALFDVTGALTLDGTLNVTDAGSFGPGIYRLFDYSGAFTNNGLSIGSGGAPGSTLAVQTGVMGQVNLAFLNNLLFWDGGGPADDSLIQGGDGTWTALAANWTDLNGDANGAMAPQPGFAVFQGTGGDVTVDDVDGDVEITGAQFAADGYVLDGDAIELVTPGVGQPATLRVGDGTALGAAMTAEIGNDLSGSVGVTKTDLGELILGGDNSWTGSTIVADGQLTVRGGSLTNAAGLYLEGVSDLARVLVDGGGQVSVSNVQLGVAQGGELTISGTGSRLETTGYVSSVGTGSASVVVEAGGSLSAGAIEFDSTVPASVVVTGADSLLTTSGLLLGLSRNAVLVVDDNGRVESNGGYLGLLALGYGQATVMNGGVWATEELSVGALGEGHLQVLDGGSVQVAVGDFGGSGSMGLGEVAGSFGQFEIRNASATIENTLLVGRAGDGVLLVDADGVLQTGAAVIAEVEDSISDAVISGGQWTNTGQFVLGQAGWGTLAVEAAGSLVTGNAVLGADADSLGLAVVTDAGSVWTVNGGLTVGDDGEGALQVRDGAVVTGGAGRAAVGAASLAEIWLTDGGVLNLDSLEMGAEGEALLNLTNGGTLTLDGGDGVLTLASDAGGYGTLTIGGAGCGCVPGAPDAAGVLNASEIVFGPGMGELYFNHTETDYDFDVELTGGGMVGVMAGTTRLTGDSADFTGQMVVTGPDARLLVDGLVGGDPLGSLTVVAGGGRLGGSGTLDHYVAIDVDGILEGRSGQTLTLGNLMLSADGVVEATLGAPHADVLFDVTGDLTLDGELHILDMGGFGAGLYGLFGYGGLLTDNGLDIATAPGGMNLSDLSLQITGDRVNLINTAGLTVTFWDGDDLSLHDNAVVNGGDGTWTAANTVWTDGMGLENGVMDPSPGFAVFSGTAGTVTTDDVDGALSVTGMQFAADGYILTGDAIELAPAGGAAIIRVGDGTAAGAGWTATIDADLTGAANFAKTDLGTLVLTGTNSWTGATDVNHGTLVFDGAGHVGGAYNVGLNAGDDGTLVIRNGGTVSSTTSSIAGWANSTGAAIVTGSGSSWVSSGWLYAGSWSTGRLDVLDGGLVTASAGISFGASATGRGEGTVSGAGSRLVTTQGLFVGADGVGVLNVLDGGVVESGTPWASIGANDGSQGVATVSGSGSRWTAAGQFYVGAYGSGALNVLDGGAVETVSTLFIGANTDSDGEATVSGLGSTLTFNALRVGGAGQGDLRIEAGGAASGVEAHVGASADGAGDLVVTGVGSLLSLTGEAVVGRSGDGGAVLADGGMLTADGNVVLARDAGSVGVLAIGAAAGDAAAGAGVLDADDLVFGDGDGTLVFNHTATAYDFGAALSGAGQVDVLAGVTTLTGDSSTFGGATTVAGGTLAVDGLLGGTVTVADGATLTGAGSIGGLTTIADGGVLSGVQGQTLGLDGLVLSGGSIIAAQLGAVGDTALFDVAGDLTLDGELEVTDVGGFGAGVYRLFDYGGDLTDNGLDITATPPGVSVDDLLVQTSVDNQVNLISTFDVELRFWDTGASTDDGAIQGGAGTWSLTGRGWTGADGAVNGAYDNPAFAVFMGTGGTVAVDGAGIGVTGMQFAVDGYEITGDGIELTEAETIVRVGDGTAAGADMTATIASRLTGAGALVKTDLGTLVLTGVNSYGGTVVRDGTLIGNADSIAGDVVTDAVLVFDQGADADFGGAISGSGLAVKRGAGVLNLAGTGSVDWSIERGGLLAQAGDFSGDVDIASGAGFTLNADADAVFSGALSGAGAFTKTGAAGLALNGDSSAFTGVAEISEGLLVLNGLLGGELRIMDGAMLAGSGSLADLTAGDGSLIAPGNSIGVLTVTGDLVFETGAIYEVEVDPASAASDLIAVGGTATLNGGVVRHIGLGGQYRDQSTYTILTATGGVTGAFDAIETDFAFLDATLEYQSNAVLMALERNDVAFPDVGETSNQRSIGAAVEATGRGAVLYDTVIGQNADGARLAFDMLSGELHGSIRTAQSEAADLLAGTLSGRMDAARTIETGAAFWAQAAGSRTRLASDGNAASLTHGAAGLMMGADAGFGAARFGLAAGTSTHDYDNHARAGFAEGDSFSLAAYGSGQWGAMTLRGAVSGTWHEVETERVAAFPGFAEVLTADYDAETVHAFVEAAWRLDTGAAGAIEPFINLARVRTESDAFTETGGDAALAVQGRIQAANLATVGIGMSRAFDQGEGRTATLSGRIGWRHGWDDMDGDGRHAFAGSPTSAGAFTVHGLPVTEDALVAELGLNVDLKDRLSLSVDWSGQLGQDLSANALAATMNWRF